MHFVANLQRKSGILHQRFGQANRHCVFANPENAPLTLKHDLHRFLDLKL